MTQLMMSALRRERVVALATMIAVTALAWFYLARMAIHDPAMPMTHGNGAGMASEAGMKLVLAFIMWSVMMIGMMLPSATPSVLLFDAANRRHAAGLGSSATFLFVAGYLAAWVGYSLAAALAQRGLHDLSLLSSSMALVSPKLSGALLLAAGLFQWSPAKRVCLRYCRSPFGLLVAGWPQDWPAVFRLGVKQGLYCIGCCWALMALMFVGGVMSLLWMALLSVLILFEKAVRAGEHLARAVGTGLILYGGWLVIG